MKKPQMDDFYRVDQTTHPDTFVNYLDGVSAMASVKAYKRQTYTCLNVKTGDYILDVGCGGGDDVRVLASLVGKTGGVVGLDKSQTMIDAAQGRSDGSNLPVDYRLGDAHSLDFADGTFDSCRADRTFQHLNSPQTALTEMIRVVRSGASVVISEPDWETLVIDTPDRALTRKILHFGCDNLPNGWIARQLPRLFKTLGLLEVATVPVTIVLADYTLANQVFGLQQTVERAQEAGSISSEEATAWLASLDEAAQSGRFFSAMTGFIVVGQKP